MYLGWRSSALLGLVLLPLVLCQGSDVNEKHTRKDPNTCCDKFPNATFQEDCPQTVLLAGPTEQFAYTPGFPLPFPIKKLCKWGIYAQPGKRIRLEFRDFYLIGPGDDGICYSQGVVIKAPLVDREMGPHCGNAGLPTIISTGNYLAVDLVSNIPATDEEYRGFKMAYIETVETPNHELRPREWDVNDPATVDPLEMERLFPTASSSVGRPPGRFTTRSSRFRPNRRPLPLPLPPKGTNPAHTNYLNKYGNPYKNQIKGGYRPPQAPPPSRKKSKGLTTVSIVGIVVGSVIMLAVFISITVKCWVLHSTKARKKKKNEKEADKKDGDVMINSVYGNQQVHQNGQLEQEYCNTSPQSMPGYYVYYYQEDENKKDKMQDLYEVEPVHPDPTKSEKRKPPTRRKRHSSKQTKNKENREEENPQDGKSISFRPASRKRANKHKGEPRKSMELTEKRKTRSKRKNHRSSLDRGLHDTREIPVNHTRKKNNSSTVRNSSSTKADKYDQRDRRKSPADRHTEHSKKRHERKRKAIE